MHSELTFIFSLVDALTIFTSPGEAVRQLIAEGTIKRKWRVGEKRTPNYYDVIYQRKAYPAAQHYPERLEALRPKRAGLTPASILPVSISPSSSSSPAS